MASRYDKGKIIGSGTFGYVWLVTSKLSRHSYVLKEINLNTLSENDQQQALKEAEILGKLKHSNIIRYKETIVDPSKNVLSIIMEYAEGGDLHAAIVNQKNIPFPERRIIAWFSQICLALQYIHQQNILHRDLKSQNIFLSRNKIKVGDFGIARVLQGNELANTAVGTPYYLSPEVFERKPYNHKSDMWALGCILYELVTLQHAFKAADIIELVSLVRNARRGELPNECNPFIRELIDRLLNVDPQQRPCTAEVLANPVLQPYLTDYWTNQNKCNLIPVESSSETNSRRSSANDACSSKEPKLKRKNSLSSINPKAAKQRTTPPWKSTIKVKTVQFMDSRPCSSKTVQKMSSVVRTDKSGKMVRYKTSKVNVVNRINREMSDLTQSCDTYVMDERSRTQNQLSKFTKSEDFSMSSPQDYGYHTEERLGDELTESNEISPTGSYFRDPVYLNACSAGILRSPNGPVHSTCPHSQCHHCMLDTLWNSRIRGVGTGVDTEERSRLENKLLSMYTEIRFSKVYDYLASFWEGNDPVASKNGLQRIMNSLNYEQIQSLPLMMQLIQLDLLVKSRLN